MAESVTDEFIVTPLWNGDDSQRLKDIEDEILIASILAGQSFVDNLLNLDDQIRHFYKKQTAVKQIAEDETYLRLPEVKFTSYDNLNDQNINAAIRTRTGNPLAFQINWSYGSNNYSFHAKKYLFENYGGIPLWYPAPGQANTYYSFDEAFPSETNPKVIRLRFNYINTQTGDTWREIEKITFNPNVEYIHMEYWSYGERHFWVYDPTDATYANLTTVDIGGDDSGINIQLYPWIPIVVHYWSLERLVTLNIEQQIDDRLSDGTILEDTNKLLRNSLGVTHSSILDLITTSENKYVRHAYVEWALELNGDKPVNKTYAYQFVQGLHFLKGRLQKRAGTQDRWTMEISELNSEYAQHFTWDDTSATSYTGTVGDGTVGNIETIWNNGGGTAQPTFTVRKQIDDRTVQQYVVTRLLKYIRWKDSAVEDQSTYRWDRNEEPAENETVTFQRGRITYTVDTSTPTQEADTEYYESDRTTYPGFIVKNPNEMFVPIIDSFLSSLSEYDKATIISQSGSLSLQVSTVTRTGFLDSAGLWKFFQAVGTFFFVVGIEATEIVTALESAYLSYAKGSIGSGLLYTTMAAGYAGAGQYLATLGVQDILAQFDSETLRALLGIAAGLYGGGLILQGLSSFGVQGLPDVLALMKTTQPLIHNIGDEIIRQDLSELEDLAEVQYFIVSEQEQLLEAIDGLNISDHDIDLISLALRSSYYDLFSSPNGFLNTTINPNPGVFTNTWIENYVKNSLALPGIS